MTRAYVRICITPGYEKRIRDRLRSMQDVRSAEVTAGGQDLIALVEGESFEAILNTVVSRFRVLEGVKITFTNFILEE